MKRASRLQTWKSHDPLLDGRREADPRLRDAQGAPDPNAAFRAEQSQGTGNENGPLLAVYRVVRRLTSRRSA